MTNPIQQPLAALSRTADLAVSSRVPLENGGVLTLSFRGAFFSIGGNPGLTAKDIDAIFAELQVLRGLNLALPPAIVSVLT